MAIDYTLTRSNRKTIGIVIKNGNVKVCAPFNVSLKIIEQFFASKTGWIEQKLKLYNTKSSLLSEFLSYKKFMYLGNTLLPQFYSNNKILVNQNYLLIPEKFATKNLITSDNFKLLNSIIKFYINDAKQKLLTTLQQTALKFSMPFNSFKITNAKSKWGSCDEKNNITLNWRLIFFPSEIIEYVAIHELAHTIHHDHSKLFWKKVELCKKEYKTYKKYLKDYSLLISLFR